MSLIILEGADGTGKTTLARALNYDYGYDIVHCGPPKTDNPMAEYLDLALTHQHAVFDRFHLGERVYGQIYRGNDRLGSTRMRMLERYLLSQNAVAVFCEPPKQTAYENWVKRAKKGEEMITFEQSTKWEEIYEGFQLVRDLTALPNVRYDYTVDTPKMLWRFILDNSGPLNKGPGIGWYTPGSVLIVGEQCNDPVDAAHALPFVSTTMSGCSWWLAQQLERAGISERKMYWINARDQHGQWTSTDFLDSFEPRLTIALGRVAQQWCDAAGLHESSIHIPHPQFWKRFRFNQPYPLMDVIR